MAIDDRLKVGREALDNIASRAKRAYYDSVYGVTKAILEPVVAATSDVLQETVSQALKEGIRDAFKPTDMLGELFFGRRKK